MITSRRFLYIHIPKCGGHSIDAVLCRYGRVRRGLRHVSAVGLRKEIKFFDKLYRFSFIREPFSWLVSGMHYFGYRDMWSYLDSCPGCQCSYLYDGDDCLMDFIGRVETLQEDMDTVMRHLGYRRLVVPVLWCGKYKPYAWTDALRDRAREQFSDDFELYERLCLK